MYWHRPANELVFLTAQEHMALHKKGTKATYKTRIRQSKALKAFYESHPGILKGRTPWNKGKHGSQTSWMKGKKMSDSTRRKISDTLKGNVPWNKGISQEERTKLKIRNSLRKIYPVRQLDAHGNIIAEYSSIFEAEEKTGIKVKYIKRVINGERGHHKGFIFEKTIL